MGDSVKHVHNYPFASIRGIRLWMSCKCIVVVRQFRYNALQRIRCFSNISIYIFI